MSNQHQTQQGPAQATIQVRTRAAEAPRPQLRTLNKPQQQQAKAQQVSDSQLGGPKTTTTTTSPVIRVTSPVQSPDRAVLQPLANNHSLERQLQQQQQQRILQQTQQQQQQQRISQQTQQQQGQLQQRQHQLRQQQQRNLQQHHQQQRNIQPQQHHSRKTPRRKKPSQSSCCFPFCCCCPPQPRNKRPPQSAKINNRKQNAQAGNDASHIASLHSRRRSESKGKAICKQFIKFLFSQIGIGALVVGYSIMGGFLFSWLESEDDYVEIVNVQKIRNETVERLWNHTWTMNIFEKDNWTEVANETLLYFEKQLHQIIKDGSYEEPHLSNAEKWSFAGSLLFSITVITTIGYGHIAPVTSWGRLATIFYALIGIPLTLICLSNIGTAFAHCFRFLYYHFCRCFCPSCCSPYKKTSKTDGQTKKMESASPDKAEIILAGTVSPAHAVSSSGVSGNRPPDPEVAEVSPAGSQQEKGGGGLHGNPGSPVIVYDTSEIMPPQGGKQLQQPPLPKEGVNIAEVRVPLSISIVIMTLYIFGGAVLFTVWETEWNYLIGAYFCFITLSTIGFGDFVFGTGQDFAANEKMIFCALYLVLGLSIIAMCFNLMQEEVRAKSRWLGIKLGIIDDKQED